MHRGIAGELAEKARAVLESNRVTVRGHTYVRPAPHTYEHQWLWDSCFHALVHLHFDPDLAKAELRALLVHQEAEGPDQGMVPHMAYWDGSGTALWGRPHASTITQPPLLAQAVLATYRRTGDLAFVAETYPALRAHYDWLARRRDPDGDGLVTIIHPWESGWDSSPRWDRFADAAPEDDDGLRRWRARLVADLRRAGHDAAALEAAGGFAVEAVDFNSIYAAGLDALAELALLLGREAEAAAARRRARQVRDAVNERMWDPAAGYYWDLAGRAEDPIRCLTPAGLIALYGGVPDREQAARLVEHLRDPRRFWTRFPVPSVAVSEPTYRPDAYWRGNVWASVNWLVIRGLERYGYAAEARAIAERFVELVARSGFHEYFHPETGQGYGPDRQSWTALVVDLAAGLGEG